MSFFFTMTFKFTCCLKVPTLQVSKCYGSDLGHTKDIIGVIFPFKTSSFRRRKWALVTNLTIFPSIVRMRTNDISVFNKTKYNSRIRKFDHVN